MSSTYYMLGGSGDWHLILSMWNKSIDANLQLKIKCWTCRRQNFIYQCLSFINIYIFLSASLPNYQQNMQSLSGRIVLDSAKAPQLWLFRGLRPELGALSFFLSPFIGGIANPLLKYRIIPYLTVYIVELIWDMRFLVFWKIGADFHNETVQHWPAVSFCPCGMCFWLTNDTNESVLLLRECRPTITAWLRYSCDMRVSWNDDHVFLLLQCAKIQRGMEWKFRFLFLSQCTVLLQPHVSHMQRQ